MHGIGNDYVYVNGFAETVDDPPALAVAIADRHFGVGGDGLILILPPEDGVDADVRMRMFNADGSEAEMCGNGIRCVAKYAHDHGLTGAKPMRVQTGNGVLPIDFVIDGDGKVVTATVDMGEPIIEASRIPVELPRNERETVIDVPLDNFIPIDLTAEWARDCGIENAMTCISMGNPHVMIYCKTLGGLPLATIGPHIETQNIFPNRINVHFVQIHSPTEVTVKHWERGSGPTLACGTGACAVCVAGVLTDKTDRMITAHLPGGDLELEWREADNHVYMTGPAAEVFSGEWPAAVR